MEREKRILDEIDEGEGDFDDQDDQVDEFIPRKKIYDDLNDDGDPDDD